MTRSFPEKTFEHWCSMHLGYRYRAHLRMWWPSTGADIMASGGPLGIGKRVLLELKTTEWNGQYGRHELEVDLLQLDAYGQDGGDDYYVFPAPPWNGELMPQSNFPWLNSVMPAQLAYEAQSGNEWFVHWTYVIPGWELRWRLQADIEAAKAGGHSKVKRGLLWVQDGQLIPRGPLVGVAPIAWRDFWRLMEQCGSPALPATFIVPKKLISQPAVTRAELRSALAESSERWRSYRSFAPSDLGTYVQLEDDNYVLVDDHARRPQLEPRTRLNAAYALLEAPALKL